MDGGLVCQYSFTNCEGNSIIVYNPIGKTLKSFHRIIKPPIVFHQSCAWSLTALPRASRFPDKSQGFDDMEFLDDPETSQEDRLHLLNDPVVRVYDSATNGWKGLTNLSCIRRAVTDVCSAMFQGHLYVLVGSCRGHHPLWRYNFSEDAWENLAVHMPGRMMIPQLVVTANRLLVVGWMLERVMFSVNGMSRECRFGVSEIKIADWDQETLFTMSNAKVMKHYSIETERVQSDICPIIAPGFGMNSLLFSAKSSRKPMVYDLKERLWSTLPQIPLGRIHDEDYFWAVKPMNLILPSTPW